MATIELSSGERHTILDGLAKLDYGLAQELAAKLKATKCTTCNGTGLAPYIGGDDDEIPCWTCDGDGFKPDALRVLVGTES
jgi:DnaJ-class molecular chaperone